MSMSSEEMPTFFGRRKRRGRRRRRRHRLSEAESTVDGDHDRPAGEFSVDIVNLILTSCNGASPMTIVDVLRDLPGMPAPQMYDLLRFCVAFSLVPRKTLEQGGFLSDLANVFEDEILTPFALDSAEARRRADGTVISDNLNAALFRMLGFVTIAAFPSDELCANIISKKGSAFVGNPDTNTLYGKLCQETRTRHSDYSSAITEARQVLADKYSVTGISITRVVNQGDGESSGIS